ncbi:thioredoxin family protein [Marinococcus sp. PL1-022]|jgi:thiol-disulfide isomerase/thioredoxin|uniref:thioredoxin family protein n=1 Tax=Marinococcus sp. PL1-022 TaxID=3095363 RepID=UPI00263754BD|nr:thioredoxin family protein [Marinococcus sp. PL1-022]MDX6151967.1 thioredoxin family protein [Marinococcus sp. PL1-022]
MENLTTQESFNKAIDNGNTVIMFSAGWCPDCTYIDPAMPEIEQQYDQFSFYKADRDELMDVCIDYGVMGIPSFLAFHNGEEVHRFVSKQRKTPEEVQHFLNESLEKVNAGS